MKKQGFFYAYLGVEYWPLPKLKTRPNFPKIVNDIPNFLALHFSENFMKVRPKIAISYRCLHSHIVAYINE